MHQPELAAAAVCRLECIGEREHAVNVHFAGILEVPARRGADGPDSGAGASTGGEHVGRVRAEVGHEEGLEFGVGGGASGQGAAGEDDDGCYGGVLEELLEHGAADEAGCSEEDDLHGDWRDWKVRLEVLEVLDTLKWTTLDGDHWICNAA